MAGEEKGVIRIISNKHTETADSIIWNATEGNIVLTSADTIELYGEQGGVVFGEYEPVNPSNVENDVATFVTFKPEKNDGSFGFDWLEWNEKNSEITAIQDNLPSDLEYIFEKVKFEYSPVSGNPKLIDELKKEYKKFQLNSIQYYVPWLSILPAQSPVKLKMKIKLISNTGDITKETITFGANSFYEVTLNGQVNENIKYTPKADGEEVTITIKCLKPAPETEIMVKNSTGKTVGKIIARNNTKTYNLAVRLVCVVKDSPAKDAEVTKLISDFKADLITNYLNENSLNQALIQCSFEIDSKYHLAFSENDWDGKYYDKKNNCFIDRKDPKGGKVKYIDDYGKEIEADSEHTLDKFLSDYKAKFESDSKKFKGLLLFITNIAKDKTTNEGGVSRVIPVDFREVIIYQTNLRDKGSYAHEIAHALGLEHTFWRKVEDGKSLEDYKKSVKSNKDVVQKCDANIKIYKDNISNLEKNLKDYAPYYSQNPAKKAEIEKQISDQKKGLRETEAIKKKVLGYIDEVNKNLIVYSNNKFKFKKGTTDYIMDYTAKRINFSKWQWEIMARDVESYYN